MDRASVALDGVSKRYGPTEALCDVTLAAGPGEIVALLGQNGAGKSTLLRIAAASTVPDTGTVRVAGLDAVADPRAARRIAGLLLAEERSHYWRLSGRANLAFFAALHGLDRRAAAVRADALLGELGLAEAADRPVSGWSTGMRMRLALARVLLGDPRVLLLDEPARSLDPTAAVELRATLAQLVAQRGLAMIVATHDLEDPAALGASSVVLHRGEVRERLAVGAPAGELAALLAELAAA